MLRYESIKQIKILVSKNLYHVLLSLAFIIVFEELFTATFGIRVKESDLPLSQFLDYFYFFILFNKRGWVNIRFDIFTQLF